MFDTIDHITNRDKKRISDELLQGLFSFLAGIIVIGLLVLIITMSG